MSPNSYTEDHLVEQPAIHLMQHELGWDVVNCYDEWNAGFSNQGRDGKREGVEISNFESVAAFGFAGTSSGVAGGYAGTSSWILNGRGRAQAVPRLNPKLNLAEAKREIDKLSCPAIWVLFAPEPDPQCNRLRTNEFLFEWKTSA